MLSKPPAGKLKCLSLDWGIAPSTIHRRAVYTLKSAPFHRNSVQHAGAIRKTHWWSVSATKAVSGPSAPTAGGRFSRGLKGDHQPSRRTEEAGMPGQGVSRETSTTAEIAAGMGVA